MAEEESKLIDAVFSVLASHGQLTLNELFARSAAVRHLSGGRHELDGFLWNNNHLFHFCNIQQKYGNQDRERYVPFVHLLFIHLRQCFDCTVGCLLNFVAESEDDKDYGDIAGQRQYYCGYDCEGLLQLLQDHEGLFMVNDGEQIARDREIQVNPSALDYESVIFPNFNPMRTLPSSGSIRDNSCIASGAAAITSVYPSHRSVTLQFVSMHWASDYIYCPMDLLPSDVKEGTIVEVEAVRMYNAANDWRATSVKRATNHLDSSSSPETKCAALFQLLRTTSTYKTADMLVNEIQPRNVFASASKLWTFVKNNPHFFRTHADMICLRSTEHIEAVIQVVNALGPGSYSISTLGDILDECGEFWKAAYGRDPRRRVLGFYHDHAELFEVLMDFPDILYNEIKRIGTSFMPTLAQLEYIKAAQKINISPAPSSTSLTEEQLLATSECESKPDEYGSEAVVEAAFNTNDAPVDVVHHSNSMPETFIPEAGRNGEQSKDQIGDADDLQPTIVTKQIILTFAALTELEKCAVELTDNCLLAEENAEILMLHEKLKSYKLRPFTSLSIFREFLAIRRHLYILDDNDCVSRLDPVRRSRVNLLLRLAQTRSSVSDLFEQLDEENRSILQHKDNLLLVYLKYKNLFEITEEFEGERFVKAKGGYNTHNEIFLPYIYGDVRIKSDFVRQEQQAIKPRRTMYTTEM